MRPPPWKVGQLAQRTGLSVRTLHWYDGLGLVSPSLRTEAGHRLYTAADVERLQQVLSLRALGFSLEEVGECLARPNFSPLELIERHLAGIREQMSRQQRLCERLEGVAAALRSAEAVSVETLLATIEGIQMLEKYYTPEQLEQLRQRREQVGEARIREVEAEWPALMAEVRAAMERGEDPTGPHVQELARRWRGLVNEFTGGDPAIEDSVRRMWQNEPVIAGHSNTFDPQLFEYVSRAQAALGDS